MLKYLIIDGSAIIHRAYHALPPFNAPNGIPTNALHGFIKMVVSMYDQLAPEYLSVIYDTPKPTFRKQLLPSYQSQRPKAPDDFKVQVPLTQTFLRESGVQFYSKEGFEADDVIATVSRRALEEETNLHVYILTGDRDILQLVSDRVTVIMPKIGVSSLSYMDSEAVEARMGVKPNKIVDLKALVGDSSDNYPGVKGIGPKTALTLLRSYGSLDSIYAHLDEIEGKAKSLLSGDKEAAYLSQKLAQMVDSVEIQFSLKETGFAGFMPTSSLLSFCREYSLRSVEKLLSSKRAKPSIKESAVDKTADNQLSFF